MAGQGTEDPTWHMMLFIVVLIGVAWTVWYFFKLEIMEGLRYARLSELWVVGLFDKDAKACFEWLKIAKVGDGIPDTATVQAAAGCYGIGNLRQMQPAEAIKYYNITPDSLDVMTALTSRYIRWLGVLACGGVGIYAWFYSPRNKFKTRHTLETLIKTQVKMWPVIAPIVNFMPSKSSARIPGDTIPDKLPVFAEALSPEEWISFHRIPVVNGIPDRETVRQAMVLQLGPRWNGIGGLPPYVLALLAAFALKGVQKREESDEFLGRLALCWTLEKGFVMTEKVAAEVKKLAFDPAIGGEAEKIAGRYAFRTTAMLGILKWARFNGGVLAPAQFLWLRGVDRNLWYPLNNLGRRSFHSEGGGAMAHFMAEEAAGKPLVIPRVDTAIVALNQYFAANPAKIPPREEPKTIGSPQVR